MNSATTASNPAADVMPGALTPELHADILRIFAAQRDTALQLRSSTAAERIVKLKRLRASVMAHRDAILEAATKDFGRSATEVEFTELMPVIMDISDYCSKLKKWLKPRKVRTTAMMLGTSASIKYEPKGRCLLIAPWNYPVNLTLGPLIPAIASGNTVMIKTSEMAPHFSAVLVSIIRDVFDEKEVAIFEGDVSVATALLDLPFDHSFFTGAPAIGKVIMAAAAKHLTSVTLELGGKSPIIVDESADIELAAKTIAWGKYINNGQTCIAPDHVYVHESVKDKLVTAFSKNLDDWYGQGEKAQQSGITRIINARHTQRVSSLLNDAKEKGAKILYGGFTDLDDRFIAPTLLGDIPSDAKIMTEEIFGPLLPIITYRQIDEVIGQINDAPKPLALYIWSRNRGNTDYIIEHTSAGGTCVNHIAAQFLHHNLPFGGVNNSGIGSYHGEWGIKAFSHERSIVRTQIMLAKIFFPPYTPRIRKILDFILKYM